VFINSIHRDQSSITSFEQYISRLSTSVQQIVSLYRGVTYDVI